MSHLKVFLSHLTVESRLADILQKHIASDFLDLVDLFVSSDITSIPVGSQWLETVVTALEASEMHFVLCSPDSISRPWIQYEAGAAGVRRLPTVPLCHSGLQQHHLPVPLSEAQGVQLADATGWQALYRTIAQKLTCGVPRADFDGYAAEVREFEKRYLLDRERSGAFGAEIGDDTVLAETPRVVCVLSPQFRDLGFQNQIDIVQRAFPQAVPHNVIVESTELRRVLATETVDILHVATYVCPRTGDMYFTDVEPASGASRVHEHEVDVLSAEELADLSRRAHTRLVVIGSCESLVLAAALLGETHVIATRDMVSTKMMARWIEVFYGALERKTLAAAFDMAVAASGAKMRLFARVPMQSFDPARITADSARPSSV